MEFLYEIKTFFDFNFEYVRLKLSISQYATKNDEIPIKKLHGFKTFSILPMLCSLMCVGGLLR